MRILYLLTVTCVFSYFLWLFHGDGEKLKNEKQYIADSRSVDIPTSQLKPKSPAEDGIRIIKHGNTVAASQPEKSDGNSGKLYKWKDENNVTIISMEPPPKDTRVATFIYSSESASISKDMHADKQGKSETNFHSAQPSFHDDPLQVYTPEGLKEFIKYSKEIGEKIEVRGTELEELVKML